jgi:VIT1/CCC1 family predicted Fe2+/Mn2+ transporter/rubrerythrin
VNIAQSLENLRLEQDAIVLYDALAAIEKEPHRAAAFRQIAGNERRHAEIWANRLREQGATVPPPSRPRLRVRFIILAARLLGTRAVSDLVKALEGDEVEVYEAQEAHPEIAAIAADELEHAEIWKRLDGDAAAGAPRERRPAGRTARRSTAAEVVTAADHPPVGEGTESGPEAITKAEPWHRSARSGTLRAVIFGVSDGLVSNLALVMGVAGASGEGSFVLLAGVAGLLAGAFSMAAGEYISMQSQRELFERQIELERAELEAMPEEEQRELAAIYVAKGFSREEADRIAERMFRDPQTALDTLVREELGLDPDELGSPVGAAAGSFAAFAVGAVIPVIPYVLTSGAAAFAASLVLSLAALFAVGAAVSLLTGKGVLFSGLRQMGIGAAAAAVTYAVGAVIGVGVAG